MKDTIIRPPKLELFFSRLNEKFGKYVVLRGYDYLPVGYSNDIDVYVPKQDLARFFDCLRNLDGLETSISILISRLGLIKCELLLEGEVIPFDILYGFYYFGLEYQDCEQLTQNSMIHDSKLFSTPDLSDEVRISLLKELLHNKRIRSDKASYLLKMMGKCSSKLPTAFLDESTVQILNDSIIAENLYLPKISLHLKKELLNYNFSKGFFKTIQNIAVFAGVKFIFKNDYHSRIVG